MDIRKLQRAIVDGLEDVKAQNIQVFNTEHLSPLFERVIIASGTSNRQTKALASSVRETVKERGMQVMRTEGEDNGEWIIVDCGAAVVHLMQPAIRDYYRLEEIWGGKPVKIKLAEHVGGLPKASEGFDDDEEEDAPRAKAAPAKKAAAKKAPAKAAPAKKAAAKPAPSSARKAAPAKKAVAAPAARKAPGAAAGKSARGAGSGAGQSARGGSAPAKPGSVKKIIVPASTSRGAASAGRKPAPAKKAAARPAAAKKAAPRRG